jgi:hypothetical protein
MASNNEFDLILASHDSRVWYNGVFKIGAGYHHVGVAPDQDQVQRGNRFAPFTTTGIRSISYPVSWQQAVMAFSRTLTNGYYVNENGRWVHREAAPSMHVPIR